MPGKKLIKTANISLSFTKYVISAGLLWWISLVYIEVSKLQKYQQVCKKWNLNIELWPAPLKFNNLSIQIWQPP